MTLFVTLALSGYAATTKTDFTVMGGMLWVGALLIFTFLMFAIFFPQNKIGFYIVTIVVLLIYGLFLIYDT